MPSWLIPVIIKLLSEVITTDNVKGIEGDILAVLRKAVAGHPLEAQALDLVAQALGVK